MHLITYIIVFKQQQISQWESIFQVRDSSAVFDSSFLLIMITQPVSLSPLPDAADTNMSPPQ